MKLKLIQVGTFFAAFSLFCSCAIHSEQRKVSTEQVEQENNSKKSAEKHRERVASVFSTLSVFSKAVDTGLKTNKNTTSLALVAEPEIETTSVFTMTQDLFTDFGVSRINASKQSGKYAVEFESRNSAKYAEDGSRFLLIISGVTRTGTTEDSSVVYDENSEELEKMNTLSNVILVHEQDGNRSEFVLYEYVEVENKFGSANEKVTLDMGALAAFAQSIEKTNKSKRFTKVSGTLQYTESTEFSELIATNLGWEDGINIVDFTEFSMKFKINPLSIDGFKINVSARSIADNKVVGTFKATASDLNTKLEDYTLDVSFSKNK